MQDEDGWTPDIETAPKDGTPVLFYGKWKPFDILPGGGDQISIFRWSTLSANFHGHHQWMSDGFTTLDRINVEFTHWRHLPPPPRTGRTP